WRPSSWRDYLWRGSLLADCLFEALAGAEAGHGHLGDVNFGAGLRVDAPASGALAEVKGAKAGNRDFLAFGNCAFDDVYERGESFLDLTLGGVGFGSQRLNQLLFRHF